VEYALLLIAIHQAGTLAHEQEIKATKRITVLLFADTLIRSQYGYIKIF
jgi:hypothetical protein